tara:strand:+ start:130 stop:1023 length:894 start_codon:yes stop_codon:yes gene_type:complete
MVYHLNGDEWEPDEMESDDFIGDDYEYDIVEEPENYPDCPDYPDYEYDVDSEYDYLETRPFRIATIALIPGSRKKEIIENLILGLKKIKWKRRQEIPGNKDFHPIFSINLNKLETDNHIYINGKSPFIEVFDFRYFICENKKEVDENLKKFQTYSKNGLIFDEIVKVIVNSPYFLKQKKDIGQLKNPDNEQSISILSKELDFLNEDISYEKLTNPLITKGNFEKNNFSQNSFSINNHLKRLNYEEHNLILKKYNDNLDKKITSKKDELNKINTNIEKLQQDINKLEGELKKDDEKND